jgi:ribosomal protein S7
VNSGSGVAGAGVTPSGNGAVVDQTIDVSDMRRFLRAIRAVAGHAKERRDVNSHELCLCIGALGRN